MGCVPCDTDRITGVKMGYEFVAIQPGQIREAVSTKLALRHYLLQQYIESRLRL